MLGKADLHIHTTCSDGRLTPIEAVDCAHKRNLKILSITDHDTIEGYFDAAPMAQKLGIELVPGVEITCSFHGREVHILGYFFSVETASMAGFLLAQEAIRRNRIKYIINALVAQGIEVDYPEVRAQANGGNIGRPHVAQVLIQKGYVRNMREAFIRYLNTEKLGDIENAYPDFREVIEIIKNTGGAVVLAHPGRMYSDAEIIEFIDAGIDGVECIHPSHSWVLQKKFTTLAARHALLITGGSDYHGGKAMASHTIGVMTLAAPHCAKMKKMTQQRKKLLGLG